MIKFKRKDFSIASSTINGAGIGASIGTFLGGGATGSISLPKFVPGAEKIEGFYNKTIATKFTDKNNKGVIKGYDSKNSNLVQRSVILGASTLIGAALGAICGTVKAIDKKLHGSAEQRLMNDILSKLKSASFKEGRDFTRDPKEANIMKTKICLVITKNAGEFRVLVNVVNDPKLKAISEKTTRKLMTEKGQYKLNQASDRYNEINISTIPNTTANVKMVVDIATAYIREGYPVYLVEVG